MSRLESGGGRIALDLHGTGRTLFIQQVVDVIDDEHGSPGATDTGKRCRTRSYRYALNEQDGSPLLRWEYDRNAPQPDYPYPLAHLHVHAVSASDVDFEGLHLPTSRVPLELVLWHLLSESEWGIRARSDNWTDILRDSLAGFGERRSDV